MNSETVDLIATAPPFNKGRDFHATPDSLSRGARFQDRWSWERDVHEAWTDAVKDDYPAVWRVIDFARATCGDDMGAFLCFMGVRIMEMRRVLKPTGSLYLHCDPTASHYLKAMLDAVFGRRNFRNEIVWRRYGSHNDASKKWGRIHDVILFYSKSDEYTWTNDAREPYDKEYIERGYKYEDERGRYTTAPLHGRGLSGGGYDFEWRGLRDVWRFSQDRLDELDAQGLIHWPKRGRIPRRKVYLDLDKGIAARDVVVDIKLAAAKERTGYPTQKPLALYERIIRASSEPGDMVLDPFAGCATTPIAAERLGRRWVGIDLWDGAYDIVRRRMEDNRQLLADPDPIIHYAAEPPTRTDEGDAAPGFELQFRVQRPAEAWQKLTHAEIRAILEEAQFLGGAHPGLVVCAGCGIALPARHFELDRVNPRAQGGENWITNRVLLCGPCNRRKRHELTLVGLQRENRREKNMENENAAKEAWDRARIAASRRLDNLA